MRSILITLLVFSSTLFFVNKAIACTPYGTPLVTQTIVGNNLNITVTSTTAWSCSYEFELELICAAANFTGNAQFQRPQTPTISKPNNANLNYQVFTIDISNLCPGTTYKYRVREKQLSFSYWSNWSAVNTFVVPGPAYSIDVTASQTLLCPPDCANLSAISQNACGPVTYNWNPNIGTGANQTVCPTAPTTYTVTGSVNVPFCPIPITASASVSIGIEPPPIAGTAAISNNVICQGQNVNISLSGYTGAIQWQTAPGTGGPWTNIGGATNDIFNPGALPAGDHCFRAAVSACAAPVYSNTVCVTVNPVPTLTVSNIDICLGQTGSISANPSIGGGTYSWTSGGQTTQTINVSPGTTTTYNVEYNLNGCFANGSGTVTVNPQPTTLNLTNTTICDGNSATLNANPDVGGGTYLWSPGGQTTQSITVSPGVGTTTYTLYYMLPRNHTTKT